MANGKIRFGKQSGGQLALVIPDGLANTEVVIPESGTLVSVGTTVTDNAIVRFDGITGDVQNSGAIIDDAGNVGIGVTPSAWHAADWYTKAIDIGGCVDSGAVWSSLVKNNSHIGIGANFYYNNSMIPTYKGSYTASQYTQANGAHYWEIAPSGTAGNPITWTNAMTLTGSGKLLVGTTTDNGGAVVQVNGNIQSKARGYGTSDLNNLYLVSETVVVDNNTLNIPLNDYGYVTVVTYDSYYAMQTFVPLNPPARLFIRVRAGAGDWSAWSEK